MRTPHLVLLVTLTSSIAAGAAFALNGNVAPNGGFEQDADANGVPDQWTAVDSPGCSISQSSNAFMGTASLAITHSGGTPQGDCAAISDSFAVVGSTAYRISLVTENGLLNDPTDCYPWLRMGFKDAFGQPLPQGTHLYDAPVWRGHWIPSDSFTTVAPATAASAQIALGGYTPNSQYCTDYFDLLYVAIA